jgi:hypothetical protein
MTSLLDTFVLQGPEDAVYIMDLPSYPLHSSLSQSYSWVYILGASDTKFEPEYPV